jgi:poly-beta-1,6-N-acetyl-D-glucosamine synthase
MTNVGWLCFWIGVAWLAYVYAGYPLLLGLLAQIRPIRPASRESSQPRVSVLISARNEAHDIGWKVAQTLAWEYPPANLEVLVASDASEDRTDEILASNSDPRLRWVRMERRGGKARALNCLAEMASGDLLLFTDANAPIGPQCLRQMVRHFADPRVGCVTGDSRAVPRQSGAIGAGAGAYWGYEAFIKRMENRLGSVLVCDGAIFAMRRSLFTPLLPDLANDLESPLRVAAAGYWTLHEPAAFVLEHDTTSPGQEIRRRRRIVAQGALGMWRMWSTLDGLRKFQFVSHKFLRWLGLIPMAAILIATAMLSGLPLFRALLVLQAAFYFMALCAPIAKAPGAWLSIPFYVVLGSAGAMLGVVDSVRGRHYDVWDIPTLSRGIGDLGRAGSQ